MHLVMIFVLPLTACSKAATDFTTPQSPLLPATQSPFQPSLTAEPNIIQIAGPLTLSRNDLFPYRNRQEYLSVVLTKGMYFEDWSPGPLMGRHWEGEFQIQLSNENGEVKSAIDLNGYFHDDLVFTSISTITMEMGISTLPLVNMHPIEGHRELLISGTGRYSTKLAKSKSGVSSTYYDNRIGEDIVQFFAWNGTKFVSESNFGEPIAAIKYDVSNLELTLLKGWNLSTGDRFGATLNDENGINRGGVVTNPFADDFDFRFYKPNHSEITNEETIDTPIGSGKRYTLDADNGTAASGILGTHDVYFAVIPIQDQIIYVLEFTKHDKEAETKMRFDDLLNGLRLKM